MGIKNRFYMSPAATAPDSLSSLLAETSSSAISQTMDENNCKPTTTEGKGLIVEKEKDRPSISSVGVGGVYRNKEEEVKTMTTKKSNANKINWQNVAYALKLSVKLDSNLTKT
uniref:Uncharacterized protein n=1 Tax=Cacopsylla melanoneura TaxID=428564 RepID=A0A8D8LLI3_9HEMI